MTERTANKFQEGQIILINKDRDWSSFDVVKKIRNLITRYTGQARIKVGHAGTLDPLATGLMIVCTGKETKNIEKYQNMEKEYLTIICLGKTTPSHDLETDVDREYPVDHITCQLLKEKLRDFQGPVIQAPPVFSAKKMGGTRAYHMARKGIRVSIEPVKVFIRELELVSYNPPLAEIRIICSKGTYIRSLARDLGIALDSGAHIVSLKRTAIGPYKLSDAMNIGFFEKKLKYLQP